ncbi:hypothetical protein [Stenotrophomonas maltophilia]|uniref:hypothetical protein n=1 Tax=Stenotrophomonas maltophilia TaxID=40324 RepID=UPI0015DE6B0E|nr:hypothetical protein [Stenotrophomonas maltophilia]HEL5043015.1 hypothetical protein [Stenotrophomonas maltophilia]
MATPIKERIGAVKGTLEVLRNNGDWDSFKSPDVYSGHCEEDRLVYNMTSIVSERISINEFPCDNCHSAFLALSKSYGNAIVVHVTHAKTGIGGYKDFHPATARDYDVFIHYLSGTAYYHSSHVASPLRLANVEPDADYLGKSNASIANHKNFRTSKELKKQKVPS